MKEALEEATITMMAMTDEELAESVKDVEDTFWGEALEAACGTDFLPDLSLSDDEPVVRATGDASCATCWDTLGDRLNGRPMACSRRNGRPVSAGLTCAFQNDSREALERWKRKKGERP